MVNEHLLLEDLYNFYIKEPIEALAYNLKTTSELLMKILKKEQDIPEDTAREIRNLWGVLIGKKVHIEVPKPELVPEEKPPIEVPKPEFPEEVKRCSVFEYIDLFVGKKDPYKTPNHAL